MMGQVPQRSSGSNGPYDHAVTRLAGIGAQLKNAEAFGAGPASDADEWSDRIFAAAAAGLDALAAVDTRDSAEAGRELVERIRRELADISGVAFR